MPEPRPGFALLEELPEALAAVTADRGSGFFAVLPRRPVDESAAPVGAVQSSAEKP